MCGGGRTEGQTAPGTGSQEHHASSAQCEGSVCRSIAFCASFSCLGKRMSNLQRRQAQKEAGISQPSVLKRHVQAGPAVQRAQSKQPQAHVSPPCTPTPTACHAAAAHLMRRLPLCPACLVTGMPSPGTTLSTWGDTGSVKGTLRGRPSSACSCSTVPHRASTSGSLHMPRVGGGEGQVKMLVGMSTPNGRPRGRQAAPQLDQDIRTARRTGRRAGTPPHRTCVCR